MTRFKGNDKEQEMAGWVANLMIQRGFSFALDSTIELGQDELVDYFLTQQVEASRERLTEVIESAVENNTDTFKRRETPDGIVYYASKRRLVDILQAEAPQVEAAPELELPRAPAPSESAAAELPQVSVETAISTESPVQAAEEEPGEDSGQTPDKDHEETSTSAGDGGSGLDGNAPGASKAMQEMPITQRYQLAVLQAMHQLGGSGKAADIVDMIPGLMTLPREHEGTYSRGSKGKSEEPKYVKYVHSARRSLIQQGELESPERGVWAITPGGTERLRLSGMLE